MLFSNILLKSADKDQTALFEFKINAISAAKDQLARMSMLILGYTISNVLNFATSE